MEHEKLKLSIIQFISDRTIPVKGKEIEAMFAINERTRKGIVEELVVNDGRRIVTSKNPPYGYLLARSDEEVIECCQRYEREAIKLFRRAKILKTRLGQEYTLFGQDCVIGEELERMCE
jgi:hypothetical protein